MKKPDKIYLEIGEDCDDYETFSNLKGVTWCTERVNDNDPVYISEDVYQKLIDALIEAEKLSVAVIRSRKGCCGDYYIYTAQIDKKFADKLYNQIKQALRNAGKE